MNIGAMGLRARIGLVLTVSFASLLGIVVYFSVYLHQTTLGFVKERLHDDVAAIAQREREKVDNAAQDLQLLAEQMLRTGATGRACNELLGRERERTQHYANIAFFDVRGDLICSAIAVRGAVNIADRAAFHTALARDGVVNGDIVVSRIIGERVMPIYRSVRESSGNVRGVLRISINVDTFSSDLDALKLPEGARILLISDKGDVVARAPDPEGFTGKNMANSDLVRKRNEFEGEGVDEVKGLDGVRRVSAFTQFMRTHDGELTLLLTVPKAVVMGDAERSLLLMLAAVFAIILLTLLLAVAISNRYLIRPLIVLSETTRCLGAGNLAVRSGLNETGGEIGAVARAFDDMAEELMRATQEREHDFRTLIENMIESCRIIDRDWKYVYVNAAFSRETGLSPEALIGHSPLELFAATRDSEWHERCKRVMETRVPESFEGPLVIGDCPAGWAQYHVQPVREGIFIFSANLTERESARHALAERMKELHCLYEVFRITESVNEPLENLLGRVVMQLPVAWQYPEDATARIAFGGSTFLAGNFRETAWMLSAGFGEEGARGELTVAYQNTHAEAAEGPFLREERVLLEAIANRLTGMIERHRALLSVQRSNRAVSAINACSVAIMRADNEVDALRAVCQTIVEQGGYCMAWVGIAEHDAGSTVRPVAFAGAGSDYIAELKVSWADNALGRGPTGRAIRLRRPEVARRIGSDPAFALWRDAALKHGYASSAALPLILGNGDCFGSLNVYATVAEAFDTEEMALLAAFANDLALGIHAHRDRAERLRAQEIERQLAFVVEQTTNAVIITDLDAQIKYVNEAFVRSSGYSREEVIGQNPRILKSGRTPRASYEAMWAALTEGRPWNGELFNRHKEGALQILRATILPLREANGSITHYVGLTEDVTAGKAAEEQLRKLSLAVEQSPESVVITNLAAEIEYVNEAFLRVTGYTREEVIGENPRFLHSGKTPPEMHDQLWATLARGEPWKGEFFNRRKDGSEYVEFAIIAPIRDADGKVTHYLAIKDDITEKKRIGRELDRHRHHLEELVEVRTRELEEARVHAEAANRAKSEFLANMSHEIRTPMNAILGLTHLLRRAEPKPDQVERLGKIDAAAQHLLSIINDILDLSKIEAGKLVVEVIDFELPDLVGESCDIFRDRAQDKGLVLEHDIEASIPRFLRGDPLRLRQLLINLIGNAVKFTEHGSINVGIRKAPSDDGELRLRFEVSDTGIGLDAVQRERLFQPFEQADASTTRRFGGSGLGLALCQRLVTLSQGSIGVDSEPGRGSTFWFELPLQPGAAPQAPKVPGPRPLMAARLPVPVSPRVLVVEDDEINREVALELLVGAGYQAEAAVNGLRALECSASAQYDLILMDVQMPEMDGLEATRELRRRAAYEHVPIIALTANVFTEDREKCQAAGMNDFIAKPIVPEQFFLTLQRWAATPVAPPSPQSEVPTVDASSRALLTVPGLDVAAGLRPVQGHWATYERLLRRFAEERGGDVVALRREWTAGRHEDARRIAHTLKGLAGTLGAAAVQDASAAVEAALKDACPKEDIEALLNNLEQASGQLITAVRAALPAPVAPAAVEIDWAQTRRIVAELDALLEADEMGATTLFRTHAGLLRMVFPQHAAHFEAELNAFRFQHALLILRVAAKEVPALTAPA